ncbi:MAG: hypothetical protein ACREL5_10535 [Gemmatimonadales bacterium]
MATDPELARQFSMPPSGASLKEFITAVKSMLTAAAANKELLVSLGLGATVLDDLTQAVAEFDATTVHAHDGQQSHVTAAAELREIGREVRQVTKALDGWFRVQFFGKPEALAGWETARNLVGPFVHDQSANDGPAPEPGPEPGARSPAPPPASSSAEEVRAPE